MQSITDSQEKKWGIRLNKSVWNPVKDWPEWAKPAQREKWTERGLIVWSNETRTITRLRGRDAMAILAHLHDSPELLQQGCVVGEPAWQISLNDPDAKGKPILANQIALNPEQTMTLLDSLEQEEETLKQMADEEEAEENRALAQVYNLLLEIAERGKHTIYDESLSWEENKRVMRQRWESGEFPKELTWMERRLFNDVLKEISDERQREDLKRQERVRRARKNLSTHHFFWERLKGVWSCFRPAERLRILQLLQDKEWDERTLAEVRQIIENAQFFAGLSEKTGTVEEPQKVTGEELRLIVDLPDETLWDELMELYQQESTTSES